MHTNDPRIPAHVAQWLAGRTALIVGGDGRPAQLRRLQHAFPDTRFIWRPTRQTDASLDCFEHLVHRADIDLVIVLHGLTRTGHSKGARRICSKIRKSLLWCRRPTVAALVRALDDHTRRAA